MQASRKLTMRKRYRLVRWLPGSLMDGNFLYQPIELPEPSPEATK